ncbi:MAG: tetratricopeptide repeat protein [Candidatus Obscuribacterales bacterium]
MRLLMLLCGALVLVSLPVIPFATMGVHCPPLPSLTQLAEDANRAVNNLVPVVMGTLAPPSSHSSAGQDLKSLDQASDQLLDQINKTPSDPSLHNRVALIYAGMGDFTSAVNHFEKAVESSRSQILLLNAQEKELRAKGDRAAAATTVLEVSKLNVELAAAHSSLARVYGELGQHEKVVAELDSLNKDIAFGSGLSKKAVPVAVAPTNSDHRLNQKTLASLARAQALMQAHRIPEAMQEYRNVIAAEPQSAIAHEKLGLAALFVNNSYLAVQELEVATRLEPDHSSTHNALGLAYQAEGDGSHAQAEFQTALSLNPKDAEAAFNLGTIYAGTGRYGPAEEAFKKAVAANPKAPMAHNHLGTLLSLSGNYKQAVQEFQTALTLAPDLASSHYGLGLALYNLKDYSNSIREFKRALVLNPGLSDAHNKIEMAYRKSGLASAGGVN